MAKEILNGGQSLKELSESIARQLAKGTKPQTLIGQLVARGWPEVSARQFVANARQTLSVFEVNPGELDERTKNVRLYKRRIIRGLVLTLIGIVTIVVGLGMRDASASLYHFAMGVILTVFEALDFLSGVSGWMQYRK